MTARNYDFILTVNNTYNFVNSNTVTGALTGTTGLIVNVNHTASTLKIKLSNSDQEFSVGEALYSNATVVGGGIASHTYHPLDGATNTFALPSFTGVTQYSQDSVGVQMGGTQVPNKIWDVYNNTNVRFKNLNYTKTLESDTANLKSKLNDVVKQNFFSDSAWSLGDSIPDLASVVIYNSTNINDFSWLIPDNQLQSYFTGTQSDIDLGTTFNIQLPISAVPNVNVSVNFGNINTAPYYGQIYFQEITTANTEIVDVSSSVFITAKNAFEQQPLVRLYTLYFPGEWYPPLESGNPDTSAMGTAYPWPTGFPVRFAEVRGDFISDIGYRVQLGGVEYTPYPLNSTGIALDSSGKINDVSFVVSNFDSLITQLVENAYLCGFNADNNAPGIVNGEVVFNIDPRTNPANVHYDSSYADQNGINVAWNYTTTTEHGDTWQRLKQDTRDLLGGVVEIRTTFAHLLDYWPEYSVALEKINGNYIKMRTTSPYRVGDIVHNNANDMVNAASIITQIVHPYLVVNNAINLNPGDKLYIQNIDAASDEFVLDTFKINSLDGLDEQAAKFSLTSWLQYFKNVSPRRSFYKTTCPWEYGGDECQYPRSGTGQIPGSTKTANGFFTINNQTTTDATLDVCAKNPIACDLRRNGIHFGGFTATGVSVPH